MKSRERLLAIGVGGLVVLLALNAIYGQISESFAQRDRTLTAAKLERDKKQAAIKAGVAADKRIAAWQHQSLPSDRQLARSLYQQWLLTLVDRVKLESSVVNIMPSLTRNTAYEKCDFQVKGDSDISMKQLVQFLYEFYATNQLHRIRQLNIKPKPDGKQLELTIDIEALLLPGADRKDKLNLEPSRRLQLADAAAYEKAIGGRNLFAEYTPPVAKGERKVEKAPPKSQFDVAKYATITGIIEDNDRPQIWVWIKTTGELLKLGEGEDFTVGDVPCKVVKIGVRDAVVTVAGKNKQVRLEDNLRDAAELPGDEL